MTDIVNMLRVCSSDVVYINRQAIDEIERLTAENEKLRAALSPFASTKADDGYDYISSWPDTVIVRCEASVGELKAARAALEEK